MKIEPGEEKPGRTGNLMQVTVQTGDGRAGKPNNGWRENPKDSNSRKAPATSKLEANSEEVPFDQSGGGTRVIW